MKPTLDVGLGNPHFLKPYWDLYVPTDGLYVGNSAAVTYRDPQVTQKLINQILELHSHVKNVIPDSHQVIIGNGATQLIGAAVYAKNHFKDCHTQKLYYFRFPEIIKLAGMEMKPDSAPESNSVFLITSPSNPMNKFYLDLSGLPENQKIYDLCYNWPTYVGTPMEYNPDIMIYGFSKAMGFAGTRVGWAFVKDASVAEAMQHYIENTSGGVSYEAQARATHLISKQNFRIRENLEEGDNALRDTVFEFGNAVLQDRWEKISALNNPKLKPINKSGMFLWATYGEWGSPELFKDHQITATYGPSVGGGMNNVRINMGCSQATFDQMIERLRT